MHGVAEDLLSARTVRPLSITTCWLPNNRIGILFGCPSLRRTRTLNSARSFETGVLRFGLVMGQTSFPAGGSCRVGWRAAAVVRL